ncbi:hypothetical protein BOSEA31B_20738 [Hyphomicrobiales bacterium]|nr:hypothetical protein BOSEA31B_20738 [Hyphomicrobiales bacterium]CAH1702765.1 hypothetical protein BOSEA1005_30637 [Hyphomicrobiales bacterium]CAI0346955.1 hypothetical protein BO1005MUT1_530131 [Hyphomicrobiales bacterium]
MRPSSRSSLIHHEPVHGLGLRSISQNKDSPLSRLCILANPRIPQRLQSFGNPWLGTSVAPRALRSGGLFDEAFFARGSDPHRLR